MKRKDSRAPFLGNHLQKSHDNAYAKQGREEKLVKNTMIYLVAQFSSKALMFVLLPVYTVYLTTSEFGQAEILVNLAALLLPIFSLQIVEPAFRFLLDDEQNKQPSIISNSLAVYCIGMLLLLPIVFTGNWIFPRKGLLWGYVCFVGLFQLIQQACRGQKKNAVFAVSGILITLVQGIVNILLIVFAGMRTESLLYAPILASIAGLVYLESKTKIIRSFSIRLISKERIKELLAYSVPLIPDQLGWWFITGFSTLYLSYVSGNADYSGILGIATKFSSVMTMLNVVFFMAWQESAVTEFYSKDRNAYYSRMFNLFIQAQVILAGMIIPVASIYCRMFLSESFQVARNYIPFLIIGVALNAAAGFLGTAYTVTKRTGGACKTTVAAGLMSIILNLLLTSSLRVYGSTVSSMLSFIFLFLARWHDTKKIFPYRIDVGKLTALSLLCLGSIATYYVLPVQSDIWCLLLYGAITLAINRKLITEFHKTHMTLWRKNEKCKTA